MGPKMTGPYSHKEAMTLSTFILYKRAYDTFIKILQKCINKRETRRSVEHCTPHADGAWLNELGWSQ